MIEITAMTQCAATAILALDLGKFNSVACVFDPATGEHRFETIGTSPSAVHDLLAKVTPKVLVIEACSIAGWVFDLATTLEIDGELKGTRAFIDICRLDLILRLASPLAVPMLT